MWETILKRDAFPEGEILPEWIVEYIDIPKKGITKIKGVDVSHHALLRMMGVDDLPKGQERQLGGVWYFMNLLDAIKKWYKKNPAYNGRVKIGVENTEYYWIIELNKRTKKIGVLTYLGNKRDNYMPNTVKMFVSRDKFKMAPTRNELMQKRPELFRVGRFAEQEKEKKYTSLQLKQMADKILAKPVFKKNKRKTKKYLQRITTQLNNKTKKEIIRELNEILQGDVESFKRMALSDLKSSVNLLKGDTNMSWKDILKMMTPREFMTEVIRHIGGGQIDDGSLKTRGKAYSGNRPRQSIKMTVEHNNRRYRILFDTNQRVNPKGEYIFNYEETAGSGRMISIKGYSLKKMLEIFKQQWEEDSNIENLAPLAAALAGTAVQAGKTMMEKAEEEGEKEIESELEVQEEEDAARENVEKLNFNVKSLSSGDGYKNSVKARDGGAKPTPVPKDAQQSFTRLRRKPQ